MLQQSRGQQLPHHPEFRGENSSDDLVNGIKMIKVPKNKNEHVVLILLHFNQLILPTFL